MGLMEFFSRKETDAALTKAQVAKDYAQTPSFTNLLPWLEFDPKNKIFLLEDGMSLGAAFELEQIGTEARSEEYIAEIQAKLQAAISEVIPEDHTAPWTVQFFLQDEKYALSLVDQIREYSHERARDTAYTKHYLNEMQDHLHQVYQEGGLFMDETVTGGRWQGKRRRVRMCLYRYFPEKHVADYDKDSRELMRVRKRLMTQLTGAGVKVDAMNGESFYEWMLRWLNPNPKIANGDIEKLIKLAPYPGDENLPYGHDFSEQLTLSRPSSTESGIWIFDGMPHAAVSVQKLRRIPSNGHITAERSSGDHTFAMFDRMPEGTVMSMSIHIKPRDEVANHLGKLRKNAVGDNADAGIAAEKAQIAQIKIAKNDTLYPVYITFLTRGHDMRDLEDNISNVESILLSNNIQPISEKEDLLRQDMYIRAMPMKFDSLLLSKKQKRSRLIFSKQIASLLPLYGRSKGTNHPGLMYFNRGGENVLVDPLNNEDRKKNAHALIIGPTGAGKSASLVDAVMKMMAVHRPRIFIVEAGDSFGLLGEYLTKHDVSVHQISVTANADISLPPFANAMKLLDKKADELLEIDEGDDVITEDALNSDDDEDRDYMGEMELSARVMITGGEKKEDDRLRRPDRLVIRRAILRAAEKARTEGRKQVITQDVADALRITDELDDARISRSIEMADALELYCTGMADNLFNREGSDWPDVDVTIFDMGILAREGYEDQLTVAYMSLMNHVHALVEREQHDGRPTIMLTDEGHIITKNAILAPYIIKIVKMWRKLGAWFWIATQNLEDFPDDSRRMLAMLEWWICLVMPKDEVDQIARFKNLSEEQKDKLLAARKAPAQYTEGVILTDTLNILFRAVPAAISLALAMTEQHEKETRKKIMDETGCDRVEAAEVVAERIKDLRAQGVKEENYA